MLLSCSGQIRAEARNEWAHTSGIVQSPVHTGLLAATGDIGTACCLNAARANEEELLPILAVHQVLSSYAYILRAPDALGLRHAFVLMGNHYRLILRTPAANASAAMQWLDVSFSAWFNKKRQRVGHVFQGRFRSTLVDGGGAWLLDLSAHVQALRRLGVRDGP